MAIKQITDSERLKLTIRALKSIHIHSQLAIGDSSGHSIAMIKLTSEKTLKEIL